MDHLSLLQQVKAYHKESFDCISSALQIDENANGDKLEAVTWYVKGISVLEKGIQVPTCGASLEDKDRITRLQAKMIKNLEMAKERLKILGDGFTGFENNCTTTSQTSESNPRKCSKPSSVNKFTAAKVVKPNTPPRVPPPVSSSLRSQKQIRSKEISNPSPRNAKSRKETEGTSNKSKRFKSVPSELANRILDSLIETTENTIKFDDVSGQETAKESLQEIVILPALRPDIFSGLRTPAKGLLLFGPPGNGKTLLAKAVASEAKSNFFNISAATLTSKWVGEGEKMVKALFAVAREVQPSVIFIDEIDSLLRSRQENENDAARRLQNEFFLQFDGVGSNTNDRILVMGATNRPHELDDAALRRFPKRIYVRLPDTNTRIELFRKLLQQLDHCLDSSQIKTLAKETENYSFSDSTELVKDAAMGPIRDIPKNLFTTIDSTKVRKVNISDFQLSLKKIRPSVSHHLLRTYEEWNKKHGDVTSV